MLLQRLVLSLLVLSFCRTATAEPEDARLVYKRAETAYALGRFAEAADLFEKTFELRQDPMILYNAAQAHRLAGNKQRALVLYQNYLRLFGEQENHDIVEKRIADLKAAIEAERISSTSPPMELNKSGTLASE